MYLAGVEEFSPIELDTDFADEMFNFGHILTEALQAYGTKD